MIKKQLVSSSSLILPHFLVSPSHLSLYLLDYRPSSHPWHQLIVPPSCVVGLSPWLATHCRCLLQPWANLQWDPATLWSTGINDILAVATTSHVGLHHLNNPPRLGASLLAPFPRPASPSLPSKLPHLGVSSSTTFLLGPPILCSLVPRSASYLSRVTRSELARVTPEAKVAPFSLPLMVSPFSPSDSAPSLSLPWWRSNGSGDIDQPTRMDWDKRDGGRADEFFIS